MDIADIRADIPAVEHLYANWGASGPSPTRVVDRIEETVEHHEYDAPREEGMYPAAYDRFDRTRASVASFLGAADEEIALTQSTTDGINRIANARSWSPDDEVVITDLEHAAGIVPWYALEREHGVDVTVLETEAGRIDPEALSEAAADASLVCFSAVDWTYGRRHPVADLVDVARDAGAMTLVDAVQAPGQMPVDVADWGADVVVGAAHKWLLGPWGAGFLYVREEVAESLAPRTIGGRGVSEYGDGALEYEPGARRFELSTTNPGPYAGLMEAINLLSAVGLDTIEDRIASLTHRFKATVPSERLLSPTEYHSGLVSVRTENPEETVERLADREIHVRSLPVPNTVRVSLHAVNTEAEVDELAAALTE
ncbi:MAG: aminotransferase class V-fold PLP-dependent enzyme [Halanaeroarchaeum sp.]